MFFILRFANTNYPDQEQSKAQKEILYSDGQRSGTWEWIIGFLILGPIFMTYR